VLGRVFDRQDGACHRRGFSIWHGAGIAFFFLAAQSCGAEARLFAARATIKADFLFTTPAVVFQPFSGAYLIWQGGWPAASVWLLITYALYVIAGLCWLPVVAIQLRMARMLESEAAGVPLDLVRYRGLFRVWFVLGWPAFLSLIVIFWLMVAKPS
jgi:uncharacterized membrane protein